MKQLLKIALSNQKYRFLLIVSLIAMCLLTFASQLEMFALGVITQKGPDFFELFAPLKPDGELASSDVITREDVEVRWKQIDRFNSGEISKAEANAYFLTAKHNNLITEGIATLNRVFPISGNMQNLAIMIIFVALFKAITLFAHRYGTRVMAIKISQDLRQEYFEHLQSLPMSFYQQHNIGSLSSRVVGDSSLIAEAINACLVNYMQTPFTVLTTLTLCFFTSWKLSLIIFFGFPLIVYPIIYLAQRVKRVSKQIQKNQERFAAVLIDFLAGIQTVKIFAMEEFSLKKYREQNQHMAALEEKSARYDLSSRPIIHTVGMFFLATALMYGLYVLHMSVAEVLFYCGLLYVLYEPIKKFAEENSHIQRGIAAAERLFEVLHLKPKINDSVGAKTLESFENSIEFNDVWFRYGDKWALKGVSFTVKKGETVAIVGPTGAGKSTIVQLLPRLYDIEKGSIQIDGRSITTYTQKSLRENIGFVPQKPFLFLDTVLQNIAFGRAFSEEEVKTAAKKAHADEFIQQLEFGYETELAEAGKNLSGGQQQRLAIARALVKNAPILIMDEATSALDNVSEHHIKTAINQLRGQVTQIIIAHRLTTIEDADKIIYLDKGEMIAEGTKEELLVSCEGFRRMWEMMHRSKNA